jgi:hypothetical protein
MNDEAVALGLGFKGERTYIQGGDIYNAIAATVSDADPTAFVEHLVFREFARRDCDLVREKPGNDAVLIAQGRSRSNDGRHPFWVTESQRDAVGRRPFDEDSITDAAVSAGSEIWSQQRSAYTPIEEIIALTKRLAYELTPEVEGKWVFGQIDLDGPLPTAYGKLVIVQKNLIAGRFSVNEITMDETVIGNIRFITGAP